MVESTPFNPVSVAKQVLPIIQTQLKSPEIQLQLDASTDTDTQIIGDPIRFRQVLNNLLGNSAKFTQSGFIRLSMREVSGQLVVVVQDSGIGIPRERLETIFESFNQADNSITRVYGGTGLGLTISRNLVRLMGGDISVTSEKGVGSSFTVTIPMPASDEKASLAGKLSAEKFVPDPSTRLLVCEDNPINELMITRVLQNVGVKFDVVRDGLAAVNAFRDCEYDLILMDVQMPTMDGLTAARTIRTMELDRDRRTPIIAVTAGATPQDLIEILASGMDDRVSKPFRPDKIRQILARWLRGI